MRTMQRDDGDGGSRGVANMTRAWDDFYRAGHVNTPTTAAPWRAVAAARDGVQSGRCVYYGRFPLHAMAPAGVMRSLRTSHWRCNLPTSHCSSSAPRSRSWPRLPGGVARCWCRPWDGPLPARLGAFRDVSQRKRATVLIVLVAGHEISRAYRCTVATSPRPHREVRAQVGRCNPVAAWRPGGSGQVGARCVTVAAAVRSRSGLRRVRRPAIRPQGAGGDSISRCAPIGPASRL
jgi:hypothetical protein